MTMTTTSITTEIHFLRRKVKALEDYISVSLTTGKDYREIARAITDVISPGMSDEETSAAWLLIRYAKRKESELEAKTQGLTDRATKEE